MDVDVPAVEINGHDAGRYEYFVLKQVQDANGRWDERAQFKVVVKGDHPVAALPSQNPLVDRFYPCRVTRHGGSFVFAAEIVECGETAGGVQLSLASRPWMPILRLDRSGQLAIAPVLVPGYLQEQVNGVEGFVGFAAGEDAQDVPEAR